LFIQNAVAQVLGFEFFEILPDKVSHSGNCSAKPPVFLRDVPTVAAVLSVISCASALFGELFDARAVLGNWARIIGAFSLPSFSRISLIRAQILRTPDGRIQARAKDRLH
jgi:hypothetical protein